MKNYKKYNDHYDDETEERVQISHITCNSKHELYDAIEKSKKDLKNTKMPYGYQKINEKIVTRVYKIPGDKYNDKYEFNSSNINYKNNNKTNNKYNAGKREYFYSQCESNPRNNDRCNCYSQYKTSNYNYNNQSSYKNSLESSKNRTIYNYNNITKNHDYYEGKSHSRGPNKIHSYERQVKTYDNNRYINNRNYYDYRREIKNNAYNQTEYENIPKKYTNSTKINGGRIENYYENEISNDGKFLISMALSKRIMDEEEGKQDNYNDSNNYYREKIETNETGGEERDYEKISKINFRTKDLGDNYKYFERNENRSPLKITETKQRRRQPYNVFKNEYYITNEEIINRNYYPLRTERETTRYYENNNYNEDFNDEDYINYKKSRKIRNPQSMQIPSKYTKTEYHYYDY